ncbi:MAG: PilZ domain-containing protein [Candidatus Omnitrophica bacterium]|nr:PilZ domain-containing protein [Candidatus Omnitrophota bacterium]MCM8799291.1 PilZ domain-containing protein [Candidatus Omnitrophota bacterium]
MEYKERRKYSRILANFIVSYRKLEDSKILDTSQTKNISLGGVLLTTNSEFPKGTKLSLKLRLPNHPKPIELIGEVVDSKEKVKNLIYDTRIQFISLNEEQTKIMEELISYYLKKG